MSAPRSPVADSGLARRISYAQCWEDVEVLQQALQVGPGDRVLSIASGGDNSIALALAGAEVVAVDLSRPQLALVELKLSGGLLPYAEHLQLAGLLEPGRRVFLYHKVRDALGAEARRYWDRHEDLVREGLLRGGRFERYLERFRRHVLPLVHRRATVRRLLALSDPAEQRRFYDRHWNTWRWRALFRVFFSRWVMERAGRDPAQFAHVEGPVAEVLLARAEHALTDIPIATNPYVQWALSGGWPDLAIAHRWLQPEGHAALGAARERVRLVHGELERVLPELAARGERFDAFNLSNIFEYVTVDQQRTILRAVLEAAAPGARVAWWELFAPRPLPPDLRPRFEGRPRLAAELLARDRAWFYGGFHVEVVR